MKIKSFKRLISFSFVNVLATLMFTLSSIVLFRNIDKEVIGQYSLFIALSGLIANLSLFGNATLYSKDVVELCHRDRLMVLLYLISRYVIFFIFFSIPVFLFFGWSFIGLLTLIDIGVLKVLRERLFSSYHRIQDSILNYTYVLIIYSLVRFFITFYFVSNGVSFNVILSSYVILSILSIIYLFREIVDVKLQFNLFFKKSFYTEYISKGSVYFIPSLFIMGFDYVPSLYLAKLKDLSLLADYAAAQKVTSIVTILCGIVSQALLPYFRSHVIDEGVAIVKKKVIYILFASLLMYSVFLGVVTPFSSQLIAAVYNGQFDSNASITLVILFFSILFSMVNFILYPFFQSSGNENKIIYSVAPACIFNIISAFFFINYYGAQGAAISLLISLAISSAMSFIILFRTK
ncbi:polysaccharide biosynthesis C-terminal domain-containing protein [Serratia oryzae]|uniref:polysaccharide biosynthesis C-terminal domain-containing protein n=1 Tax=Serratia oryzae TaxID=2034155 RepID=UPI0012E1213E|nr:polysaccharide biosynthesis C-terminal domain-containing protein [Serratia oryzae]